MDRTPETRWNLNTISRVYVDDCDYVLYSDGTYTTAIERGDWREGGTAHTAGSCVGVEVAYSDTDTNPTSPFGAVRCVSDRYDRDGSTYADEAEFLAMCEACFGGAPALVARHDGWHDDEGLVLVSVGADND